MLLRRAEVDVATAIEQVMGLNAQESNPPYLSLWSRVEGFERSQLTRLVEDRTVVRSILMRCTQRLVTAEDFRWMRPALRPMIEQAQRSTFGRGSPGSTPRNWQRLPARPSRSNVPSARSCSSQGM